MAARTLHVHATPRDTGPGLVLGASVVALVAAAAVSFAGFPMVPALLVAAFVPAVGAAAADHAVGRVPDLLVGLVATAPLLLVVTGAAGGGRVALGAALTAAPLLAVHLASPSAMGFGDVKLAAALGALLGVVDPRAGLLAVAVGSGATAAVAVASRRRAVPFAPGLVTGAAVALATLAALGSEVPRWR